VTLKQEFSQFLKENFNGLEIKKPLFYDWNNGLRFDLQTDFDNTEAYFKEVNKRASDLFEAVFDSSDEVYVVINKYKRRKSRIHLSSYVFKQLENFRKKQVCFYTKKHLYEKSSYDLWNRAIVKIKAANINHKSILKAIGNTDFPTRNPRINGEIHFINLTKKLVLNMYDDRGLDIIAKDMNSLMPIYKEFRNWILEYDKVEIERKIKENGL
jgi:hypothetical protein